MRAAAVVLGLVVALVGCKGRSRAAAEPEPNRNPYRDVTPQKMKQKVEDAQKREDEHGDKVLENAK